MGGARNALGGKPKRRTWRWEAEEEGGALPRPTPYPLSFIPYPIYPIPYPRIPPPHPPPPIPPLSSLLPLVSPPSRYDAMVINRIDFRLKRRFKNEQHMEFVWDGSPVGPVGGKSAEMFTHVLYKVRGGES